MTLHSASVPVGTDGGQFLLSFLWVVEQEVRKIARRCRSLSEEDLYSEAVLHALERSEYIRAAQDPVPYLRIVTRQFLARFAWEYDSLVKTPRVHGSSLHAEPVVCISLDLPLQTDEDAATLADVLPMPEGDAELASAALRQALLKLTDQQRAVLLARFGTSGVRLRSYRAIAKELGVSLGSAHRLADEGLAVLRRELVEVAG
jgi:RNA polymerase sigma factor (sigma-70 family)